VKYLSEYFNELRVFDARVEASHSSEMLVPNYETICHHISGHNFAYNRENLEFYPQIVCKSHACYASSQNCEKVY